MAKNGKKKIVDFECECMFDPCCKYVETDDYEYIGNTSLRENVKLFMEFGAERTWFNLYQVEYEPRQVGDWEIHKFIVDEVGAFMHNIGNPDPGRWIVPGHYTSLLWHGNPDKKEFPKGQTIMSDTPSEISDHVEFIDRAYGRVLINGLGLGVVANALLREEKRDCIEHIDVVELNPEVIELTGYYFKDDPKITIHRGDAYDMAWPHGKTWHCAWHDIWYTINPDDVPQQDYLHAKYENRVTWQDSWHRRWLLGFLDWMKKQEAANG